MLYGKYRRFMIFGSMGGVEVFLFIGGLGGGWFKIIVYDMLVVDGVLFFKGGIVWVFCSGGGSGGSILVYILRIYGDGEFDVFGGDGDSLIGYYGGGGGGGCVCLYYCENYFLGCFFGVGGSSVYELGGLGIVFLENVFGMNVIYGYDCIDEVVYVERIILVEDVINGI